MRYNLDVLNDKEFEDLAKDLLDVKFKINFEIFKAGRDSGIDLRYSKEKPNEIVVQIKHYIGSVFSNLKSQLKREKIKLNKFDEKPGRYIVFTSLPLNPAQSTEIKELLEPYVKSTGDIYGRHRVESLIAKNPEIEKKYYKLWLTSTNVMRQLLHNAVSGNSEFQTEKIMSRSKFYVQTRHIEYAFDHLNTNKFLIISGEPGVGKTTLAYMLVYQMMVEGYKLIYSDRSIREAEDVLSNRAEDKQVVLIDDFLGSNLHDIYYPVNSENSVIRFIDRIKSTPNKYLIFTSRTTILSQASQYFESFHRDGIKDMSTYEMKISAYTNLEKAKILYNHLYHFKLSDEFKEMFFVDRNYLKIIKHPNYYPRLIESLTNENNFQQSGFSSVKEYVFKNLDNPTKIWVAAFEKQLTRFDQIFIESLFTFGDKGANSLIIEQAFENRILNEDVPERTSVDINAFNNCLKKLQDGFVRLQRNTKTDELHISFINPSVADFLMEYLQDNHAEKYRIWSSNLYLEQFEKTYGTNKSGFLTIRKHEQEKYLSTFIANLEKYKAVNPIESVQFKTLDFLWRIFPHSIDGLEPLIIKLIQPILDERGKVSTWRFANLLNDILDYELKDASEYVLRFWDDIFEVMVGYVESADDLQAIVNLHEKYDKNFGEYLENEDKAIMFNAAVGSEFEAVLNDHDFNSEIDVEALEYYGEKYIILKIEEKAFELYEQFLEDWKLSPYVSTVDVPYELDSKGILDDYLSNLQYDHDDHFLKPHRTQENIDLPSYNEDAEIERIFER